jgi:SAM-dependent methyltransferase
VARLHGAERTYLVDAGPFAETDLRLYRQAAQQLSPGPGSPFSLERWTSLEAMLVDCRAHYLTQGLASLQSLPDASVDLVWSQAVLEHVRRSEFEPSIRQLRRVLRPGGVMSHQIDLRDHLGGRLNNLRFSPAAWEGRLLAESGFYTNRLRFSEILAIFKAAGLETEVADRDFWPALPTPRAKLDPTFRRFSDDDLRTSGFRVIARPAARST